MIAIFLSFSSYRIEDIEGCASNNYPFNKIKINLLGDNDNED